MIKTKNRNRSNSRVWDMINVFNINNLAKNQVSAVFHSRFAEVCHPMPLGTASLPTPKCIGNERISRSNCIVGQNGTRQAVAAWLISASKHRWRSPAHIFLEIFLKGNINYLLNVAVTEMFAYQITCAPWYLLSCNSLTYLLPVKQPYLVLSM